MSKTTKIRQQGIPRFSKERWGLRTQLLPDLGTDLAVELMAGSGEMTSLLKTHFAKVITNDLDKTVQADYHLPALEFAATVLPNLGPVDYIDIDSYGQAVPELYAVVDNLVFDRTSTVIVYGDAYRLYLRMRSRDGKWKELLGLPETLVTRPWEQWPELLTAGLTKHAQKRNLQVRHLDQQRAMEGHYLVIAWEVRDA